MVLLFDPAATLIFANDAGRRLAGRTPTEPLGAGYLSELLPRAAEELRRRYIPQAIRDGRREYLELLDESAEQLLKTINEFLDLTNLEARKLDLQLIDFDLRSALRNLQRLATINRSTGGNEPRAPRIDLPYHEAKRRAIDAFERQYVEAVLARHDGNVSQAARAMRLTRKSLARVMARHRLAAGPSGGRRGRPRKKPGQTP